MSSPIIHFDYEFSPYGQKTKLLLEAADVDYKRVDQPLAPPRKDLEALGITYRRIPVLAVGKDIYADSSAIIDVILDKLAKKEVPRSTADKAWETWGYQAFAAILSLVPHEFLSPDFVKDRSTIFPIVTREDYKTLRPSGLAELRSRLSFVENTVLTKGTYAGGDKLSVADAHILFGIQWGLKNLRVQEEKGFGKDAFPKFWKLLESLPEYKAETISSEEAIKAIKGADTFKGAGDVSVAQDDFLQIKAGTPVTVESTDSTPGSHPQAGKLIGSSTYEVVLELDHGIRLHFPREGYIVRASEKASL